MLHQRKTFASADRCIQQPWRPFQARFRMSRTHGAPGDLWSPWQQPPPRSLWLSCSVTTGADMITPFLPVLLLSVCCYKSPSFDVTEHTIQSVPVSAVVATATVTVDRQCFGFGLPVWTEANPAWWFSNLGAGSRSSGSETNWICL